MVGVSRNGGFKVVSVVGPDEMLAEVYTESTLGDNVVTESTQGRTYSTPREVWVTGISTVGLVDGVSLTRTDLFKVTGTKTYQTAGAGIRTVFVIEPVTSSAAPPPDAPTRPR
jgi:hypothetical protein